MMPTRRTWIQQILAAAGTPLMAMPARGLEVDRLLARYKSSHWSEEHRLYRVDAALVVLSSPLHWFRGIGHGFLAVGETSDVSKATFLRFGAASSAERAGGFDRAGFIEEASQGDEFASFGFITSGHDSRSNQSGGEYTAMDLSTTGRVCWFRRAGVPVDVKSRFSLDNLIGIIRGALPNSGGPHQMVQLAGPHPTFLHALLRAVQEPVAPFCCTYVYNAKQFDLTVDRREDARMAEVLRDKGLTRNPDIVRRYDGTIRDGAGQSTRRQWSFRFWREDHPEARLPLRIEFQPKEILRLSLELSPMRTA